MFGFEKQNIFFMAFTNSATYFNFKSGHFMFTYVGVLTTCRFLCKSLNVDDDKTYVSECFMTASALHITQKKQVPPPRDPLYNVDKHGFFGSLVMSSACENPKHSVDLLYFDGWCCGLDRCQSDLYLVFIYTPAYVSMFPRF